MLILNENKELRSHADIALDWIDEHRNPDGTLDAIEILRTLVQYGVEIENNEYEWVIEPEEVLSEEEINVVIQAVEHMVIEFLLNGHPRLGGTKPMIRNVD